jgi:hypothetical protein
MKQPRTNDFDPNAKERELKSSMEDFPAIERPQQVRQARVSDPGLPDRPGRGVLPVPTSKRKIKSRHAFDIYEDQVEVLQKLSLEDRMRGGAGSMSAMVREAIDDYIAKYRSE